MSERNTEPVASGLKWPISDRLTASNPKGCGSRYATESANHSMRKAPSDSAAATTWFSVRLDINSPTEMLIVLVVLVLVVVVVDVGHASPAGRGTQMNDSLSLSLRALSPSALFFFTDPLSLTVPLPFFPNSARAYVNALPAKGVDEALKSARYQFQDGYFAEIHEAAEPNVRLVFAGIDPLTADGGEDVPTFGELAEEIFSDLDRYRKTE